MTIADIAKRFLTVEARPEEHKTIKTEAQKARKKRQKKARHLRKQMTPLLIDTTSRHKWVKSDEQHYLG